MWETTGVEKTSDCVDVNEDHTELTHTKSHPPPVTPHTHSPGGAELHGAATRLEDLRPPTMRVFIVFQDSCEPLHVSSQQTVWDVRKMVQDNFLVPLSDGRQQQHLELSSGGAALRDSWTLSDVGITSGSAIRCLIKSDQRPVMSVFNAVTGETFPVLGSETLLNMSVSRLKTLVSRRSGLPVSTFTLSTANGVTLYNCNTLQDYNIEMSTTLRLDTWDGWVEFLQGCLHGNRLAVQRRLSARKTVMRFQLQVALYIAAASGHLALASWLLERGARPEQPVGVHPHRQWCHQTSHQDTGKCPVHAAAESSRLLILKLFITKNPVTLASRDPGGRDPLKVALQHGHRECVRYIANKLCSVVSPSNIPLPLRLYVQIKRWVSLGQKRAASRRWHYNKARVEDQLWVDGFNQPNVSSKSRIYVTKPNRGIKVKAVLPLSPIGNFLSASHPPSMQSVETGEDGLLEEIYQDENPLHKSKFILPPISRARHSGTKSSRLLTAPLRSHHCGQTPGENAMYCFTIASAFTEKPWLKRLSIARTLIRKHVRTTT